MIIVTSGSSYLDIDAYAGCIAYAELLNQLGIQAKALSSAPFNESVIHKLRDWDIGLNSYSPNSENAFVLVDVSDISYFDPIVILDKVVEVIDHHSGYEDYWRSILGEKACIERVGSACTQIYERWKVAGALSKMKPGMARLLLTAILDNTLNFSAHVTTLRDCEAYKNLSNIAGTGEQWRGQYFYECQTTIESNLPHAIRNDAKIMSPTQYLPEVFGQLVIWDARQVLKDKKNILIDTMNNLAIDWVLNIVSICERRSYLMAENLISQQKIKAGLGMEFSHGVASYHRLKLRKEWLRSPCFLPYR